MLQRTAEYPAAQIATVPRPAFLAGKVGKLTTDIVKLDANRDSAAVKNAPIERDRFDDVEVNGFVDLAFDAFAEQ